jgi:hypothetical protein
VCLAAWGNSSRLARIRTKPVSGDVIGKLPIGLLVFCIIQLNDGPKERHLVISFSQFCVCVTIGCLCDNLCILKWELWNLVYQMVTTGLVLFISSHCSNICYGFDRLVSRIEVQWLDASKNLFRAWYLPFAFVSKWCFRNSLLLIAIVGYFSFTYGLCWINPPLFPMLTISNWDL